MLSTRVRELSLERADGLPMRFEPGQWVMLQLAGVSAAYSIASPPTLDGRFSIAVRHTDESSSTKVFLELAHGDEVTVLGPRGRFTRDPDDPSPALFVGHGSGITPLRSMILAARPAAGAPLGLLYGARTLDEVLYREDFERLAGEGRLLFDVVLSAPHAGHTGFDGRVQRHVARAWESLSSRAGAESPSIYLCGASQMVEEVRAMATSALGIAPERVHFER